MACRTDGSQYHELHFQFGAGFFSKSELHIQGELGLNSSHGEEQRYVIKFSS
jgi:hypothetical protein